MNFYSEHREILPFFFLRVVDRNYWEEYEEQFGISYTKEQKIENSFFFKSDFHKSFQHDLDWKESDKELAISQQCEFFNKMFFTLDQRTFERFVNFHFYDKLKSAFGKEIDNVFAYQCALVQRMWECKKNSKKLTKKHNHQLVMLQTILREYAKEFMLKVKDKFEGDAGLIEKVFHPFGMVTLTEDDYRIDVDTKIQNNFLNYMNKLCNAPASVINGKLFENQEELDRFIQTYFKIGEHRTKPAKGFQYAYENFFKGDIRYFFHVLCEEFFKEKKLEQRIQEILLEAFPKFKFSKKSLQSNFAKLPRMDFPKYLRIDYSPELREENF